MKRTTTLVLAVLTTFMLQACGGGGGDSDGDGDKGGDGPDFTYTLTYLGFIFVVGAHINLVQASITSCPSGTPGTFSRVARGLISNATGPVTLSFDVNFPGAYVESAYIDFDNSNSLSNGDRVLGGLASGTILAVCRSSKAAASSFTSSWVDLANNVFGGQTVFWTGGTMSF